MLKKELEEKLAQAELEIAKLCLRVGNEDERANYQEECISYALTAIDAYKAIFKTDCTEQLAFDHIASLLIG